MSDLATDDTDCHSPTDPHLYATADGNCADRNANSHHDGDQPPTHRDLDVHTHGDGYGYLDRDSDSNDDTTASHRDASSAIGDSSPFGDNCAHRDLYTGAPDADHACSHRPASNGSATHADCHPDCADKYRWEPAAQSFI